MITKISNLNKNRYRFDILEVRVAPNFQMKTFVQIPITGVELKSKLVSKVGDRRRGRPEGSFFISYYPWSPGPLANTLPTRPMGTVIANGPGDRGSIPGRVIPNT